MTQDQKAIKTAIAAWIKASKTGDVKTLGSLLADDVVFIGVGRPPFGKKEFFKQGASPPASMEAKVDVKEINVYGEVAQTWVHLDLAIVAKAGMPELKLSGPTMSVWRREKGRWVIARDANMLATLPSK